MSENYCQRYIDCVDKIMKEYDFSRYSLPIILPNDMANEEKTNILEYLLEDFSTKGYTTEVDVTSKGNVSYVITVIKKGRSGNG